MLVSTEKRFVFVHVYKTAGSSVTRLLAPWTTDTLRSSDPKPEGPGWQATWHFNNGQHVGLDPAFASLVARGHIDADYRVLTVVRNPYSWQHSVWSRFFSTGATAMSQEFSDRYPARSFDDYLRYQLGVPQEAKAKIWGSRPQSAFLASGLNPEVVAARFESLDETLEEAFAVLGLPFSGTPKVNVKRHRVPLETALTDAAVCMIGELCEIDFVRFGYRKCASAREVLEQLGTH